MAAQRSSRTPKAAGKAVCWHSLLSPCFFPCQVKKGRPLQGNLVWKIIWCCAQVPEELSWHGEPPTSPGQPMMLQREISPYTGAFAWPQPLRERPGHSQREPHFPCWQSWAQMECLRICFALLEYLQGCGTRVFHHPPCNPLKGNCFARKRDDCHLESFTATVDDSHSECPATPATHLPNLQSLGQSGFSIHPTAWASSGEKDSHQGDVPTEQRIHGVQQQHWFPPNHMSGSRCLLLLPQRLAPCPCWEAVGIIGRFCVTPCCTGKTRHFRGLLTSWVLILDAASADVLLTRQDGALGLLVNLPSYGLSSPSPLFPLSSPRSPLSSLFSLFSLLSLQHVLSFPLKTSWCQQAAAQPSWITSCVCLLALPLMDHIKSWTLEMAYPIFKLQPCFVMFCFVSSWIHGGLNWTVARAQHKAKTHKMSQGLPGGYLQPS